LNPDIRSFRSNGKLLISAEYFVLFGAKALALPTVLGQELIVKTNKIPSSSFSWITNVCGKKIFSAEFDVLGNVLDASDHRLSDRLTHIFNFIIQTKGKDILRDVSEFESNLEFSMEWGLGSSSTLIYALASWADMDPFLLQKEIFGGSGYDIACAGSDKAVMYQLNEQIPSWTNIPFNPSFKDDLFFVYLNKKENSREAISLVEARKKFFNPELVNKISSISLEMVEAKNLKAFSQLMTDHESIVSSATGKETVKAKLFMDYPYAIKSLGAWGGDFILVEGHSRMHDYFIKKGYETCISYKKMILNSH